MTMLSSSSAHKCAFLAVLIGVACAARAADRYIPGLHLELPRVKARLEQFDKARREQPAIFEMVEPYRQLIVVPTGWNGPRTAECVKPLGLELLHPDYTALLQKYPGAYEKLKEVCERGRNSETEDDYQRNRDEFLKLEEEFQMSKDEFRLFGELYSYPSLVGCRPLRLDPKFQIAWEETLIRPGSWVMRGQLLPIVVLFDDPASTPILGELMRLAMRDERTLLQMSDRETGQASERLEDEGFAAMGIKATCAKAIYKRPSKESLVELSDTIRLTEGEPKERARVFIGSAFCAQETPQIPAPGVWQAFLSELENDKDYSEHVRTIRDAIEAYKQYREKQEKK